MSALGQKRTCAAQEGMSALPPIATAKANCRKRSCLLHPQKQTDAGQNEMSAVSHKGSGSGDQFIRRDREERHELVSQRELAEKFDRLGEAATRVIGRVHLPHYNLHLLLQRALEESGGRFHAALE